MKKILILFLSFFCSASVEAQEQKIKNPIKVTFGAVFALSGTTTFSDWRTPFTLGYNLSPNVCLITNKTYHNLLYGFSNNTVRYINGYFLNKKKDVGGYVAFGKSLTTNTGYIAGGIEKILKLDNVISFLFSEVQFNNSHEVKIFQVNIGVHVNIQAPLYTKK